MSVTLQTQHRMSVNSERLISLPFDMVMYDGESLTGTPTATEVTTSALTIGNEALNTEAYRYRDEDERERYCGVGQGVEFAVTTAAAATYAILVSVVSSRGQTFSYEVTLIVE